MSQVKTQSNDAAKEAAEAAVQQAHEVSKQVVASVSGLDPIRMTYLAAMSVVVVSTLIFNMASFSVGLDVAVSETTAQAQRVAEAKLNSWSYSAFTSTIWGKLMWLSALGGNRDPGLRSGYLKGSCLDSTFPDWVCGHGDDPHAAFVLCRLSRPFRLHRHKHLGNVSWLLAAIDCCGHGNGMLG